MAKRKEMGKPIVLDKENIEEDIKEINLYTNEKKQEQNKNMFIPLSETNCI